MPREPPYVDLSRGFKEVLRVIEDYGVQLESLWIIPERDSSGSLRERYHGEFVAQVPRNAIVRFTKPYELVLDPFVGYGTTLVECLRLGRHGIGVEVEPGIAEVARRRVASEPNPYGVRVEVVVGDSRRVDFRRLIEERGFRFVDLVIAHPPYYDIIKYGDSPANLCNAPSLREFLRWYGEVVDNVLRVLKPGSYYVLVVGDKYEDGEWVPLGFYTMSETLRRGLRLKAICVKNIEETAAKRGTVNLWRYRVLKAGTYYFKHEYVMFFRRV
jgi:DNA modification methylase